MQLSREEILNTYQPINNNKSTLRTRIFTNKNKRDDFYDNYIRQGWE